MKGFRYKPVGWKGESHRHYLAAKGIKTKYFAYRGTYPEDEERMERIFGADPRLKLKRDKSVIDIQVFGEDYVKDVDGMNPQGIGSSKMGGFAALTKKTGEAVINIPEDILDDGDDEELKTVLKHELTHTAEFAKNKEAFIEASGVPERATEQGIPIGYFGSPAEYHAYTQTDKKKRSQYRKIMQGKHGNAEFIVGDFMNISPEMLYYDGQSTEDTVGLVDAETQKFNKALRNSPNLRELPDMWDVEGDQ